MSTEGPIKIKGKTCVSGSAEGEALVISGRLSLLGEINEEKGLITKEGPGQGKEITGKILVYYSSKGSSGDAFRYWHLQGNDLHPAGIINVKADPIHVQGAILANIPTISDPDRDPFEVIRTGDHVKIDNGDITIWSK